MALLQPLPPTSSGLSASLLPAATSSWLTESFNRPFNTLALSHASSQAIASIDSTGKPFVHTSHAVTIVDTSGRVITDRNSIVIHPSGEITTGGSTDKGNAAIAFIDSSVDDYQRLIAGLRAGTEVHVLDPLEDAIAQITQTLVERSGISSVHIFSHGSEGNLELGGGSLSLSNLGNYARQIASWAPALTANADILLYGCDLAASNQGQMFVQQLSQLTGADIAASTDPTGSAALGGDWVLEFSTGSIEALEILKPEVQATYNHILATFGVTNTNDSGAGSLRQAIQTANTTPGADTIVFSGAVFANTTPDTITLTSGPLTITDALTIDGPGATLLTISGNNASRVFQVNPSVVATIEGVTIGNGREAGGLGGGVFNNGGTLALVNTNLNNNTAQAGGGIFNSGLMLVNGGTFTNNLATLDGGGVLSVGDLTLSNSNFNNNRAQRNGGSAYNAAGGRLTVNNSYLTGSNAGVLGGGIFNESASTLNVQISVISNGVARAGGGIFNLGTLTMDNSLVRGNRTQGTPAQQFAGGIYNGGVGEITNSTIGSNTTAGDGGGILNDFGSLLRLSANSLVSSNRAANGGGIYNDGTVRVQSSSIIQNRLASPAGVGPDLNGAFISEGLNTIGRTAGSTGFVDGVNGDTVIFS